MNYYLQLYFQRNYRFSVHIREMNTLNCTSPIRACDESTSFNIFVSFICLVSRSGTHANKKLEISAFDSDFSFWIFIGFKNRRSHLNGTLRPMQP